MATFSVRFGAARCTATGVAATVKGAAGEAVSVTVLAPAAADDVRRGAAESVGAAAAVVVVVDVAIPASGEFMLAVP